MTFFRRSLPVFLFLGLLLGASPMTRADLVPVLKASEKGAYQRNWLVCGPFPNTPPMDWRDYDYDRDAIGFWTDLLAGSGGEAKADPIPREEVADPLNGETRTWKAVSSQDELVSFEKIFGPHDYVVAYAFCHILAQAEEDAILSVGSNDGIRVLLNGELVHDHHLPRWLGKDTDFVPIRLKPGTNRLLIKVDESSGDWGFSARLLDREETLAALEKNLEAHSKFSVITEGREAVALFGEPYQIETLNPGAKVTLEARDEQGHLKASLRGRPGVGIPFPLSSFEEGPLHFTASFPLGGGRFVEKARGHYVGRLPRHPLPQMIRPDLSFVREGKPFYPIGTYGASPGDYKELAGLGYNFVVGSPDNLDAAQAAGLLVAIGFHGDDEAYLKHLEETVREYKDHPAVLCWMLADEPGHNRMDLLNMHRAYELVHELDPVHPSYLVITRPGVYETFGRCCDVLAIDTYPISKKAPISDVGKNIANAYRSSDGDLPVWQCGQTFNWPSDRMPTPEEHRFMTYQSLMEGAKGILWFTYRWEGKTLPEADPVLWAEQLRLLEEMKRLEPLLLAPGLGTSLRVESSAGSVRASFKEVVKGGRMVIAVNTSTEAEEQAAIPLPEGKGSDDWEVLGESRMVDAQGDRIEDRFAPLGVHVYLQAE